MRERRGAPCGLFSGPWDGADLVWLGDAASPVTFTAILKVQDAAIEYMLALRFPRTGRDVSVGAEAMEVSGVQVKLGGDFSYVSFVHSRSHDPNSYALRQPDTAQGVDRIYEGLSGVHYYRWVSRFLSLPVAADLSRRFKMEPSGFGLASCLDDILGYDRARFTALEDRFKTIFPQVKSIKLIPQRAFRAPLDPIRQIPVLQEADGKGIFFEFVGGGKLLAASQVSDGFLLVLAYLTVLYLPEPPRTILVEEPENGMHPKRLADVTRILRELIAEQGHSQVILTTHSPYLLDSFAPDEVTVCRKKPDGSIAVRRLSESKKVREQIDIFTLGEIWGSVGDDALAEDAGAAAGERS